MQSGMIGKVEKARRYACERDRFRVREIRVVVQGDNAGHEVSFDEGVWECDCEFFVVGGACAHTMAMERVLDGMLSASPAPGA